MLSGGRWKYGDKYEGSYSILSLSRRVVCKCYGGMGVRVFIQYICDNGKCFAIKENVSTYNLWVSTRHRWMCVYYIVAFFLSD